MADHVSLEVQVQLALEQVDFPPRNRKQLIAALTPIFASVDAQLAEIRSHVGMDEPAS